MKTDYSRIGNFEFLFNKINDAVYLHKIIDNRFGKFLRVNDKACEMLGYSRDELLNMSPRDLNHPKKPDSFYKKILKEIIVKKEVFLDINHLSSSGKVIPVELNINYFKHKGDDYLLAIARDISLRKEKEKELIRTKNELQKKNKSLELNNKKISAINENLDNSAKEIYELNMRFMMLLELFSNRKALQYGNEEEFLTDILETAVKVIPESDYGSVYKYKSEKVNFVSVIGYDIDKVKELDLPAESFYNINDEIEVINHTEVAARNNRLMGEKNHMNLKDMHQLKQMLRMDLKIMGETKIGLNLDIDIESSKTFSNNSLKIFRAFQNIASSFYTMREYNHLQNSFTKELISSLIKLLEMHDIYTKGHSENVAKLASKLAKKMGLSQKIINDTYWTGMVHDMGKILIPIELLNKSEKLTEEEYELIKEHPVLGSQALENSDSLKHISEYVRYHHERWDGKGYPDGLSGYEIPIVAQIIQVADSWDAMRSKRVYTRALSFEEAFEEIKINRGRQFAPRAAHHFLEMLNNYEVYSDVLDEYDF